MLQYQYQVCLTVWKVVWLCLTSKQPETPFSQHIFCFKHTFLEPQKWRALSKRFWNETTVLTAQLRPGGSVAGHPLCLRRRGLLRGPPVLAAQAAQRGGGGWSFAPNNWNAKKRFCMVLYAVYICLPYCCYFICCSKQLFCHSFCWKIPVGSLKPP